MNGYVNVDTIKYLIDIKTIPIDDIVEIKHGEWVPITDVVEVKHGEWVRTEVGSEKPWKCSECGYQPVHYSTQVKPYEHYCGNCGADMRGKENGRN